MILQPQEYFTIFRQLGDPNDSTTYYVQAVVRNARTDVVLDTVQLTDRTNRRFSKAWQVPVDTSGLGFYISIVTTVYTDAAYTSKSDSYTEEANTYLIDNRFRNLGGGGGGGADVDYKKIRAILEETLRSMFFDKKGEFKFLPDISPILKAIDALGFSKVSNWIKTSMEKLAVVDVKLNRISADVKAIDVSETDETDEVDLTPVLQAIEALPSMEKAMEPFTKAMESCNTLLDEMKKNSETFPALTQKTGEIEKQLNDFLRIIAVTMISSKSFEKPIPVPPDYQKAAEKLLKP